MQIETTIIALLYKRFELFGNQSPAPGILVLAQFAFTISGFLRIKYIHRRTLALVACGVAGGTALECFATPGVSDSAQTLIGRRLFYEGRFAEFYFRKSGGNNNVQLPGGDPVLAARPGRTAGATISCAACHVQNELHKRADWSHPPPFMPKAAETRSKLPARTDGLEEALRNAPSLVETVGNQSSGLFHFDGEFSDMETLVAETLAGRNYGWLPEERAMARAHLANVIRDDQAVDNLGSESGGLPYSTLFLGTDGAIPADWRLSPVLRLNVRAADDGAIISAVSGFVTAYLQSLHFSRDVSGAHNGSAYDAFLAANRLARAPAPNEAPALYARRLNEAIAALLTPSYIVRASKAPNESSGWLFGPQELLGMKIFFRSAVGAKQKSGAGNCADCHVPPDFTDREFHNTGVSQVNYDAKHGAGAFLRLILPSEKSPSTGDKLLPGSIAPASSHAASAPTRDWLLRPVSASDDFGLWNVYANPNIPKPQDALERLLNPDGRKQREVVLGEALGRFKTSTVRDLPRTAPYLHTGELATLEEVISFYKKTSDMAHQNTLRNAPPEFFGMRLEKEDVQPLAAFLRSLSEIGEANLPPRAN